MRNKYLEALQKQRARVRIPKKSKQEKSQEQTKFMPRSYPRHLVRKKTAQDNAPPKTPTATAR